MQGQYESDRHGARLDEKLPTTFSACHVEVFSEMNKKHGCALPSTDKILNDRKDSKQESCGPKSDVCVNPDPGKKLPEIDWKKVEPMPMPKFPRIDEPMPKAPPKIDDTLPKYPKHGESGPKLPVEKDLDSHGRSTDKQPGGRSQSGEATPRERPKTDCGFGGGNHSDGSRDQTTRRSSGGAERQAPHDSKPSIGNKANVMKQFPTVELFAH